MESVLSSGAERRRVVQKYHSRIFPSGVQLSSGGGDEGCCTVTEGPTA